MFGGNGYHHLRYNASEAILGTNILRADIGWPMSHEGFFPSGDPSVMKVTAEHYVHVNTVQTDARLSRLLLIPA